MILELGAKIGNAYVDTGYAIYGIVEATQQLKDNTDKLNKLKDLQSQGKASQHAVDIASVAVTMATVNLANSLLQAASSAAGAATAAATSLGTGMYGALYGNVSSSTSEYSSSSSEAVGSNLLSGGDFNFNSNNANITGSVVGSVNGKTTVDISNSLVLTQGENNYSVEQKSHMEQVGMQIGTAGYQPNQLTVGFSEYEREQTNYTKAQIIGGNNQSFDGILAGINGSITTQDQSNIAVNAGGKVDSSQNNLKDYSLINSDSDATMSIDLRPLTKAGREDIVRDVVNIGHGKFITDNLYVAKTNINTIKNLGESAVNTVKGALGNKTNADDMNFTGTYKETNTSFEMLNYEINGISNSQKILEQNKDKFKTYNNNPEDGTYVGTTRGFNHNVEDVMGINTNKQANKTNGDYSEVIAHEYAHKNGANEQSATRIGELAKDFHNDYSGKYGFADHDVAGRVGSLSKFEGDYVNGLKFGDVDPLLVVGRGTFSGEKPLTQEEIASLEKSTGQKVIQAFWQGDNTKESRSDAAQNIKNIRDNYVFGPGEPFLVGGHSNFGNVIKEFSQGSEYGGYKVSENQVINTILGTSPLEKNYTPKPAKTIDGVFMFATPHRDDYWFNDKSMSSSDAPKVSFYDPIDIVQKHGWIDSSIPGPRDGFFGKTIRAIDEYWAGAKGLYRGSKDIQNINGFQNIEINQTNQQYFHTGDNFLDMEKADVPLGPIESHSALFTPNVWEKQLPQFTINQINK